MTTTPPVNKEKIRFSRAFWVANVAEALERAAFYGVFVVLTMYLSKVLGFTDIEAGIISGIFSSGLYFLPTFSGALADKIGFRKSMLLAFGLLTIGYIGTAVLPTILQNAELVEYGEKTVFKGLETSSQRWAIVPVLLVVMVGGSFIKSVITGTVAKETSEKTRAKGFAIFYMMVNIGAFSGKTIVDPLRRSMGDEGLVVINYFAATMTLAAFILIYIYYKSSQRAGQGKSFAEIGKALGKVLSNTRLVVLIFIIAGFWLVQNQMYATMPKYVTRLAGESATPGWYANVNPLIVVIFVSFITHLMRRKSALFSMTIGMAIMPISALLMASGNLMGAEPILGLHPVAFMMIVGIMFQGLAETFISPRYLEYFSKQAPKGEEGMYLGFGQLHSFLSYLIGFIVSGFMLEAYCPDPEKFATHAEWAEASQNAHYIWYVFMGVAMVSTIALIAYGYITRRIDAKKQLAGNN